MRAGSVLREAAIDLLTEDLESNKIKKLEAKFELITDERSVIIHRSGLSATP